MVQGFKAFEFWDPDLPNCSSISEKENQNPYSSDPVTAREGVGDRADDPCKAILLVGVSQLIIRTGTKQKIKHLRVVVVVLTTYYSFNLS